MINVTLTLNGNSFSASSDDATSLDAIFLQWLDAQAPAALEAVTNQLKQQNDGLAAVVAAHQPEDN